MTIELLNKILIDNNIPKDAKLMSDSGWYYDATEMNGIFYNSKENILVFTQYGDHYEYYFKSKAWTRLYQDPESIEKEKRMLKRGIISPEELIPDTED